MYFAGDEAGTPYYNGKGSSTGAIGADAANPGLEPWQLSQKVQGSFDPSGSNYHAQLGNATTMIDQIKSGGCKGQ